MIRDYELHRLPFERGEVYRVMAWLDGQTELRSAGKIEMRDRLWVAIGPGDLEVPVDGVRFATPGDAAEGLIRHHNTTAPALQNEEGVP